MILGGQRHILSGLGLGLFLCLVVTVLASGITCAQEPLGERVLPAHYPDRFDGTGRIDRIAPNEVVIDDSLHGLSSSAAYHTLRMRDASRSSFHAGDLVGYLMDSKGKITSIWLIDGS